MLGVIDADFTCTPFALRYDYVLILPTTKEAAMKYLNYTISRVVKVAPIAVVLLGLAWNCFAQSDSKSGDTKAGSTEPQIIRVRAGADRPLKDSKGNSWLPDKESKDGGFVGGDTIERPDIKIENTKDPDIYRAEHYSMDSFSWKV